MGIVWELISERFEPNRLRGAAPESIALRRPCDDHPLEDVPRLYRSDDPRLRGMFGSAAERPLPDPTAMIVRHHTCVRIGHRASASFTGDLCNAPGRYPSLNPLADARDVLRLLQRSSSKQTSPGPGQYRVISRAGGACAALVTMQGVAEVRFELVESTGTGQDYYSTIDFMEYQRQLHRITLEVSRRWLVLVLARVVQPQATRRTPLAQHGDYNSFMDTHIAFFMGVTFTSPEDQDMSNFVDALKADERLHLTQGRNHFESVFFLTKARDRPRETPRAPRPR